MACCVAVPLSTRFVDWMPESVASSWRSICRVRACGVVWDIVPSRSITDRIEATASGFAVDSGAPVASRSWNCLENVRPFDVTGAQTKNFVAAS